MSFRVRVMVYGWVKIYNGFRVVRDIVSGSGLCLGYGFRGL